MTNALDLLLAYPHGLIVTGTVLLISDLSGSHYLAQET